jgi:lipopolysaccharide export system ATP-binding protein
MNARRRLLPLLAALAAMAAAAADEPRRAPVNLRADRIELDPRTGASRYRGHVVLVQGTLKLTADRAEASAPGGVIRHVTAYGNPATFREQLENGNGVVEGEAKQLDYDTVERNVILTGAVEIRRAEDGSAPPPASTWTRAPPWRRVATGTRVHQPAHAGPRRQRRPRETLRRAAMSVLTATHLGKQYKGRAVVRDVSLSIESGEIVGLLGPNGAGKTTCFYMIVGLVPLDSGEIHLDKTDLTRLPMHERCRLGLSYLPQEPSVFRKLTIEDNIMAILEAQQGSRRRNANTGWRNCGTRIRAASQSRPEPVRWRAPAGEIARAGHRPRFILLDEPFAGVDPISVLEIQQLIMHLKQRGIGVLITDHNVRETLKICDRAYILSEGKALAAGAPADILYNEEVKKVYLGEDFRL